jgi:hypothetical protein
MGSFDHFVLALDKTDSIKAGQASLESHLARRRSSLRFRRFKSARSERTQALRILEPAVKVTVCRADLVRFTRLEPRRGEERHKWSRRRLKARRPRALIVALPVAYKVCVSASGDATGHDSRQPQKTRNQSSNDFNHSYSSFADLPNLKIRFRSSCLVCCFCKHSRRAEACRNRFLGRITFQIDDVEPLEFWGFAEQITGQAL